MNPIRLRFSLRTLLLLVLLIGSAGTLWRNWEPWALEHILTGHKDGVLTASFSPDGNRVLTGGADGTARVWDVWTGREVAKLHLPTALPESDPPRVWPASFSPDGKTVLATAYNGPVLLWQPDSSAPPVRFATDALWAEFSPDGRRVVTGDRSHTATIWNAADGKQLTVLRGHENSVDIAVFSPDGTRIATGSRDHTARIWDADTGKTLFVLTGGGSVGTVAFASNGKRIIIVDDLTVGVFDAENGALVFGLGAGGDRPYISVSQDGQCVAVGGRYSVTVAAVDKRRLKPRCQIEVTDGESAMFSPDGEHLLSVSRHHCAITDLRARQEVQRIFLSDELLMEGRYSPRGDRIVITTTKDARIYVRRRPEYAWGVVCLVEFWLTLVLAGALVWSVRADGALWRMAARS